MQSCSAHLWKDVKVVHQQHHISRRCVVQHATCSQQLMDNKVNGGKGVQAWSAWCHRGWGSRGPPPLIRAWFHLVL